MPTGKCVSQSTPFLFVCLFVLFFFFVDTGVCTGQESMLLRDIPLFNCLFVLVLSQ